MQNPYASPTAHVADLPPEPGRYQPRVFSTEGRIGRLRYVAYSAVTQFVGGMAGLLLAFALTALASARNQPSLLLLALLVYVPVAVAPFVMAKRRLNDLDQSGWLSLLFFIPLANLVLALYLLFWPGSPGPNRYGPKPAPNSWSLIVAILAPLILLGTFAAITWSAYNDYMTQAQHHSLQRM